MEHATVQVFDDDSASSGDPTDLSSPPSMENLAKVFSWDYTPYLPQNQNEKAKVLNALEASLHFSVKLLFHAYKEPRCNAVVSPFSTTMSMSVLILGSNGKTQSDFVKAVFDMETFTDGDAELFETQVESFRKYLLLMSGDLTFKTILYVNEEITPDETFVGKLRDTFGADVKEFRNRQQVNSDFRKATQGRVRKILSNANKGSSLLLVSALYFKPVWNFLSSKQLISGSFFVDEETVETVSYINGRGVLNVGYNPTSCFTVVELPIGLRDLSLLIYLPDEGSCIENLFPDTDSCHCETITASALPANMSQKLINVLIPKLTLEHTRLFRNFLPTVGIDDALSAGRGSFYTICTNYYDAKVALTDVVVKTVLEFSPESCFDGISNVTAENDDVINFTVNRPFFYALTSRLITDRRLFLAIGYMRNPKQCGASTN